MLLCNGWGDVPTVFLGREVNLTDSPFIPVLWAYCEVSLVIVWSELPKVLPLLLLAGELFSKIARLKAVVWKKHGDKIMSLGRRFALAKLSGRTLQSTVLVGCTGLFPSPHRIQCKKSNRAHYLFCCCSANSMIKQLENNSTQPNSSSWSSDSSSMTLFLNMQKISQNWTYFCMPLATSYFSAHTWISFSSGDASIIYPPSFL